MVRVRGPMFSLAASGTIGKTIVYSRWKGRPYVRQRVTPVNPDSGGQVSTRVMFTHITQMWPSVVPADQATWEPAAAAASITPGNAQLAVALARNRSFLAPYWRADADQSDVIPTVNGLTAVAAERQITVGVSYNIAAGPAMAALIYRSTSTGFTPQYSNLVGFLMTIPFAFAYWIDSPLEPGTYYYDTRVFTYDGTVGPLFGEVNATVP